MERKKFAVPVAVLLIWAVALMAALSVTPVESGASQPKKFSSYAELDSYIKAGEGMARQMGGVIVTGSDDRVIMLEQSLDTGRELLGAPAPTASSLSKEAESYSTTNVQVEGVDEADLVKSDGKYLYVVSGSKVQIIEAYPAENARVLSALELEGRPADIYINQDRLAVFTGQPGSREMAVQVYDLTDRSKPVLTRTFSSGGSYVNSRMIGDFVYVVVNVPVTRSNLTGRIQMPELTTDKLKHTVRPEDVYYFDNPDYNYMFSLILSFNIQDENKELVTRTFLTGVSQNLYVSPGHIYLTNQKLPDLVKLTNSLLEGVASVVPAPVAEKIKSISRGDLSPDRKMLAAEQALEDHLNQLDYNQALALEQKLYQLYDKYQRDLSRDRNQTVIHKLAVNNGDVTYRGRGEVPGQVLNQFSMDEHKGYFRIATTTAGSFFDDRTTRNHIYVLDEGLDIAGRLEGLAPTERIYSARFMGDRVYLVTFRQIDPFFVIDLKDPQQPKVLGELKIPGYSDYLHPYDENHIIGIGKEVPEMGPVPLPEPMLRGDAAPSVMPTFPLMEQGVKIALFDVSDPAEPRELAKYVVNKADSDSPVLRDHRALLFSRDLNLLAIPVSYSIAPTLQERANYPYYKMWQGLYVFDLSPAGITLRGSVDHLDGDLDGRMPVKRSLYIGNVLYTVSDGYVQLNDLDSLNQIKRLELK